MPFDSIPQNVNALAQQHMMFRQRREDAAALWRSIPESSFAMSSWQTTTTACALGWLANKKHNGWQWINGYPMHTPLTSMTDPFLHAADYFGISVKEARNIFGVASHLRRAASISGALLNSPYPLEQTHAV